jgi:predicted RNase H-like HicB family nuclease
LKYQNACGWQAENTEEEAARNARETLELWFAGLHQARPERRIHAAAAWEL